MARRVLVIAFSVLTILASAAEIQGSEFVVYDRSAKNRTGLRASDVCLSCRMPHKNHPAREAVQAWQPTRVEWSYITDPDFISFVQDQGAVFVGTLNTIKGEGPDYDGVRFDAERMVAPWMTGFNDRGGPGWNTLNKPATLSYQLEQLRAFIEQGVRTFQHDDWLFDLSAYNWGGGDFSEAAQRAFASYLASAPDAPSPSAVDRRSWDGFRYGDYLRETHGWQSVEELKRERGKDPLTRHWRRFHLLQTRDYFEWLLDEAGDMAGEPVCLSVNARLDHLSDMFLLDLVDYLVGETRIQGETEENRLIHMLKLADALQLPQVVSPFPKDHIDVAAVRRSIALTYALGHRMLVPWDVWAGPGKPRWFGTVEEYGDLYRFVRENAARFDGYRSCAGVTVVVPLSTDHAEAANAAAQAEEVGTRLASLGIAYRYATFGTVGGLVRVPLDKADFDGARAVVCCGGLDALTREERGRFDAWTADAAVIDGAGAEAAIARVLEVLGGPSVEVSGAAVLALPRSKPGAPLVVHLVNRGKPNDAVRLRVASRLLPGEGPFEAILLAPGKPPRTLEAGRHDGAAEVTVHPGLWAIAVFGE